MPAPVAASPGRFEPLVFFPPRSLSPPGIWPLARRGPGRFAGGSCRVPRALRASLSVGLRRAPAARALSASL